MSMNRHEHLQWAKGRALEYIDAGDPSMAFVSITAGELDSPAQMREFIDGFN